MVNPIASSHISPPAGPVAANQSLKNAPGAAPEASKGKGAAVDTAEFSQAALKKAQEAGESRGAEVGESAAQETQESNGSSANTVQASVSGAK